MLDELTDDTGTVTASLGYGWSCESDLVLEDINLPGNTGSGEQTFTYDRAGRLSSWDKTGGAAAVESCGEGIPSGETYTYDARGNRLTAGSRSFTYDNRNRLTTDPDGDYSWSAAGAMETFTDTGSGVTESFTRDAAHRLTGVSDGTDSVAYSYDVLDRIATRDTSEAFAYAGAGIDPVADGTDSYARSSSQALFAYEPASGGFLFPMTNLHGDVVGYIDSTGALVGVSTYDPYGDPDDTTGTTSRLGYQGNWTEPDNGRVWMGARWYQPSTATFLTRDTYFGELRTPFSLNQYTYVINATPYTGTVAEMGLSRAFEFAELRGDPMVRDEYIVIAGKCIVGPIRIGDRFSAIVDHCGEETSIDLRILDIGFYGGYIHELDPALSAELTLVGEASIATLAGATLRGRES